MIKPVLMIAVFLIVINICPVVTNAEGTGFSVNWVSLYFENGRPETTAGRNTTGLKAHADIVFAGSGLLEGYWEVDGRVIGRVSRHVTGGRITIESPALPTFDLGTRIVSFVITGPPATVPSPSILYFLTPENTTCSLSDIKGLYPEDGAQLIYAPVKFSWQKVNKSTHFLIGFYEKNGGKPLFSAYTKDAAYTVPESVLKSLFAAGKTYYWSVKGFDSDNNIICENRVRSFSFNKKK